MPDLVDKIKFFIGDAKDLQSVQTAVQGVDYIFYVAALKQIPYCEFFLMITVKTNVIGSDNVLIAAIDEDVECDICFSAGKVTYPVNAMSVTKVLEERVAVAKSRNSGKMKGVVCVMVVLCDLVDQ